MKLITRNHLIGLLSLLIISSCNLNDLEEINPTGEQNYLNYPNCRLATITAPYDIIEGTFADYNFIYERGKLTRIADLDRGFTVAEYSYRRTRSGGEKVTVNYSDAFSGTSVFTYSEDRRLINYSHWENRNVGGEQVQENKEDYTYIYHQEGALINIMQWNDQGYHLFDVLTDSYGNVIELREKDLSENPVMPYKYIYQITYNTSSWNPFYNQAIENCYTRPIADRALIAVPDSYNMNLVAEVKKLNRWGINLETIYFENDTDENIDSFPTRIFDTENRSQIPEIYNAFEMLLEYQNCEYDID